MVRSGTFFPKCSRSRDPHLRVWKDCGGVCGRYFTISCNVICRQLAKEVCDGSPYVRWHDLRELNTRHVRSQRNFQQANHPFGNRGEANDCFSGNHKLDGYEIEVSIPTNELAINVTKQELSWVYFRLGYSQRKLPEFPTQTDSE